MTIENSIYIEASPKKVYSFFENIEANYLKWHPEHRDFKWIKGRTLAEGNIIYFEEEIGGELLKKEAFYSKVIPNKYIAFKLTNRFLRILLPKMTFIFDPKNKGCLFTQQVFVRVGPMGRWINRKQLAAVDKHQQEECENLKEIMNNYKIKVANPSDQDFLFEMLYQSIFYQSGTLKPDKSIIEAPEISKYVENWGKAGDFALIAMDEKGKKVGAAWLRYFDKGNKGYGYIADDIPELGLAVDEFSRGKGIGSLLLKEILIRKLPEIKSISLSTQIDNPATRLYIKFNFHVYERSGDSIIMKYDG